MLDIARKYKHDLLGNCHPGVESWDICEHLDRLGIPKFGVWGWIRDRSWPCAILL